MVTVTMVTDIPARGEMPLNCDGEREIRRKDGRGEKGERKEISASKKLNDGMIQLLLFCHLFSSFITE